MWVINLLKIFLKSSWEMSVRLTFHYRETMQFFPKKKSIKKKAGMWNPEVWTSRRQELWSRKVLAGNALKSLLYASWCSFCLLAELPSRLLFNLMLYPPSVMAAMLEKNEARISSAVWPHFMVLSVQLQLWELVVMCFCCRVLSVLGLGLSKLNLELSRRQRKRGSWFWIFNIETIWTYWSNLLSLMSCNQLTWLPLQQTIRTKCLYLTKGVGGATGPGCLLTLW